MRGVKGKGFFGDLSKSVIKTAAPVLVKAGTDYAVKKIAGNGIPINPRMMVRYGTLNNGTPQVKTSGKGYAGFGYA